MMKDGVAQANQVMQQVQTGQALAERLANEGVDGSATINQVVPPTIILQPGATVPVKVDPNDHSQLLIALAG
jgi:hypothetical protein